WALKFVTTTKSETHAPSSISWRRETRSSAPSSSAGSRAHVVPPAASSVSVAAGSAAEAGRAAAPTTSAPVARDLRRRSTVILWSLGVGAGGRGLSPRPPAGWSVDREQRDGHPRAVVTLGGPDRGVEHEPCVELGGAATALVAGRGQERGGGQAGAAVDRGGLGRAGADAVARAEGARHPAEVLGADDVGVGHEVGGLAGGGPSAARGLVGVAAVGHGERRQVAGVAPAVGALARGGELDAVAVVADGEREGALLVDDGDVDRDAVGVAGAAGLGQRTLPDDEVGDLVLEAGDTGAGGAGAGLEERGEGAVVVTLVGGTLCGGEERRDVRLGAGVAAGRTGED